MRVVETSVNTIFDDTTHGAATILQSKKSKKLRLSVSQKIIFFCIGLGFLLIVGFLVANILWFTSRIGPQITGLIVNPTSSPTHPPLPPTRIATSISNQINRPQYLQFDVESNSDYIEVVFSLYDKNRNYTTTSGTAKIIITNDKGVMVYSKVHLIGVSDFGFFTQSLTGKEFKTCSIKIPLSQIKKSVSENGFVDMKFTANGDTFSPPRFETYGLPSFTKEELVASADQQYGETAIEVKTTQKVDNYLSVTVHRIGLMTFPNMSESKTYIRVDITAENIGSEKIDFFFPDPIILGKSSNQFEKAHASYENEFQEGQDIYPGVRKSGTFFFGLDENSNLDIKELIINTGLSDYDLETRIIGTGQALLYNKDYVFVFDLSSIVLKR